MKYTRSILVAALLLGFSAAAVAADHGTANGSRVNVRGQAKLNSEVVTQLKKGERVTIIDEVKATAAGPNEPKRYYKIILPGATTVWVSANYIKDGRVTANRLNVRSGAGENFSVLGRLAKGTAVSPLRTVGEWTEISSPGGVHGFVATSLIKADTSAPAHATVVAPPVRRPVPPVVPVMPEPVMPAPPSPDSLEVVEVASTPIIREPAYVPAPAPVSSPAPAPTRPEIPGGIYSETTVVSATPDTSANQVRPNELLTPPAEPEMEAASDVYNVIQPSQKTTMLGRWWDRVTTRSAKPAPAKPDSATAGNFHQPAPLTDAGPPAVRIVTREGVVVRAWNIQAPSDWALKEIYTGKIVNYLWSGQEKLPWNELRGRTVLVTGEEAIDPRWQRTPVLHIQTLKTIDGDGDGEG